MSIFIGPNEWYNTSAASTLSANEWSFAVWVYRDNNNTGKQAIFNFPPNRIVGFQGNDFWAFLPGAGNVTFFSNVPRNEWIYVVVQFSLSFGQVWAAYARVGTTGWDAVGSNSAISSAGAFTDGRIFGNSGNEYLAGWAQNIRIWGDPVPTRNDLLGEKWCLSPVCAPNSLWSWIPFNTDTEPRDQLGLSWVTNGTPQVDSTVNPPLGPRAPARAVYIPAIAGPTPAITGFAPSGEYVADGQPNCQVVGTDFEAQGAGSKIEITDGSTTVECTVTGWTDTTIDFTAVTTGVNLGAVNVIVTNNSGNVSAPYGVTHLANLQGSGGMSMDDVNARIGQAAGTPITISNTPDVMAHVLDAAPGSAVNFPQDFYGR